MSETQARSTSSQGPPSTSVPTSPSPTPSVAAETLKVISPSETVRAGDLPARHESSYTWKRFFEAIDGGAIIDEEESNFPRERISFVRGHYGQEFVRPPPGYWKPALEDPFEIQAVECDLSNDNNDDDSGDDDGNEGTEHSDTHASQDEYQTPDPAHPFDIQALKGEVDDNSDDGSGDDSEPLGSHTVSCDEEDTSSSPSRASASPEPQFYHQCSGNKRRRVEEPDSLSPTNQSDLYVEDPAPALMRSTRRKKMGLKPPTQKHTQGKVMGDGRPGTKRTKDECSESQGLRRSTRSTRPSAVVVSEGKKVPHPKRPHKPRGPYMNESERISTLQSDDYATNIKPTSVDCTSCKKTIRLDGRFRFYLNLWRKHKRSCLGNEFAGGASLGLG